MDLQDKIYVEHYRYPQVHEIISSSTFEFLKTDKYYEKYTEIQENESWTLTFEGNPDDKLYIDGLSLLKDENIQKDENDEYYISPDAQTHRTTIQLYNPSESDTNEVSGYLPGNFLLKLVTSNNEIFYSWLKVNPKFVDKDELESMRNEVDELVQELSLDHYKSGNFGSYYLNNSILTMSDIETLSILHSSKEDFLSNYQELINDPKKKIKLSYAWANKENGSLDQISIKEMTKHPEKGNQVFGKIRTVTPNMIENTDLKKNFIFLEKRITKLIKHINIESLNNKFSPNLSLEEDKQIAELYLSLIRYALNQEWLKEISVDFLLYDNVLTLDHRYLFFRKLVWKIRHVSYHKPKFLRQYNYYWKRTELLYELWGYLKVIKAMQNIGFSTDSGWFFDSDSKESQYELVDGTTVNMTLNRPELEILHAKVIYNKRIKGTSQNNVEKDDPIWCSSNHNKPDIRINIYDSEMTLVYVIVLDSKYRKLASCVTSKNWNQLNDYSTSLFSEYPYKSERYKDRINSIETTKTIDTATFILYPQGKDEPSKNPYSGRLADGRIQAVGLRPKSKSHDLEEKLKSRINKIEKWI